MKRALTIEYRFELPDGGRNVFALTFDEETFERICGAPVEPPPAWTALEYHQCPNCPLRPEAHPRCPVAVNLIDLAEGFGAALSYDEVLVQVTTPERTVMQRTTVQRAVSSLLGLLAKAMPDSVGGPGPGAGLNRRRDGAQVPVPSLRYSNRQQTRTT